MAIPHRRSQTVSASWKRPEPWKTQMPVSRRNCRSPTGTLAHLLSSANQDPASRRALPLAGRHLSPQGWSVETSAGLHARSHHEEVGPLSRGVTLKPLSGRLQPGLRFFPDPLPAYPTAFLAISLPVEERADIQAYPVPHRQHEQVRFCLSTGGA